MTCIGGSRILSTNVIISQGELIVMRKFARLNMSNNAYQLSKSAYLYMR